MSACSAPRSPRQVEDFHPEDVLERKQVRRLERFSQLAVVAGRQALADGCLNVAPIAEEVGSYIGSALGGVAFGEDQHTQFVRNGVRSVSPLTALSVFGGAAACNLAMDLGIFGPALGNANSCASGTIAIGEAFRLLRDGDPGGTRAMLAGGAEAPLAPLAFGAFALIKAMSSANDTPERASRPFDAERDGFVMGEGSAVLAAGAARRCAGTRRAHLRRNPRLRAHQRRLPHDRAPARRRAGHPRDPSGAADAGVAPEQIDYVNAHASSTPLNDATEVQSIRAALGTHAERIPVTGTKGLHGHALGASGAFEAAIACLAIEHQYVPGTANLRTPDPACDLQHLPGRGRHQPIRYVLCNSFGFGGINACLVLGAPDATNQEPTS